MTYTVSSGTLNPTQLNSLESAVPGCICMSALIVHWRTYTLDRIEKVKLFDGTVELWLWKSCRLDAWLSKDIQESSVALAMKSVRLMMFDFDLSYALLVSVERWPQTTCLYLALSCAAASVFISL